MSADSSSGEAQSPPPTFTRRGLLKTGAAAGAGAAFMGAGSTLSPIGEADALACGGLCVGAIVVGGSAVSGAGLGWTLREHEVIGSDPPPDGLSAGALENQVFNTAQTRKSTNASTFIDNQNILQGAEHVAYSDAKIAAIEALNNQETKANVTSAGQAAVDDYETTIKTNLLNSWNESVLELDSFVAALSEHSDIGVSDLLPMWSNDGDAYTSQEGRFPMGESQTRNVTLPDGSDFEVREYSYPGRGVVVSPMDYETEDPDQPGVVAVDAENPITYLRYEDWNAVWSEIETVCQNVRDGIALWVDEIYDEVQAGALDTEDLLTPRELAELSNTEEDDFNQAVADLLALNIPIDLEREAEINISSADTTLYGMLGVTSEVTLEAGDTVDPSSASEDYYLTYDVSEANGDWTAFETAVDGGIVTFTDEPHPEMLYQIETAAGETAEVSTEDFSETDSGGAWETDISEQVETAITEVNSVAFYSASDETNNVTVQLDESFEIVGFTNNETGESVDSVDYTSPTEPETDSNYITEEEWQQREENYKELIDEYEQSSGGGGGGLLPDFGLGGIGSGIGGLATLGVVGWVFAQLLGSMDN